MRSVARDTPPDAAPCRATEAQQARRSRSQRPLLDVLVFTATVLATAYPALASLYGQGFPVIFKFFAGDAFYYLAVAEHSIGKAFYTFDGTFPTNGFHPLWQYYLRNVFELLGWQGDHVSQLLFTFVSSVGFVAVGTGLFALTLLRLTGRPLLAVLGVLPGAHYLLFALIDPQYGSPWAFVNGMESPLTILLGGALAYLLIGRGVWGRMTLANVAGISLLATLLTLSRLDDVFLFIPLLLGIALYSHGRGPTVRHLLCATVIPTLLIGAYLLYNLTTVGVLLPMSGLAKAQTSYGGLALSENLAEVLRLVSPSSDGNWVGATWRVLQMVVPLVVAGLWLVYRLLTGPRRPATITGEAAVSLLAVYVVAKGLYNLVNVRVWDQGHWYYPLSIFTANLILALFLHKAIRAEWPPAQRRLTLDLRRLRPYTGGPAPRLERYLKGALIVAGLGCVVVGVAYLLRESVHPVLFGRYSLKRLAGAIGFLVVGGGLAWSASRLAAQGSRASERLLRWRATIPVNLRPLWPGLAAFFLLFAAAMFANQKQGDVHGSDSGFALWRDREAIAARLEALGGGGVVEIDDGIFSYSLPGGAMSGFGLALDKEAFQAWNRAELLDVAYERGYRLLALGWYAQSWPEAAYTDPAALEQALAPLIGAHSIPKWTFRPFYVEREGEHAFAFIEFAPRAAP